MSYNYSHFKFVVLLCGITRRQMLTEDIGVVGGKTITVSAEFARLV